MRLLTLLCALMLAPSAAGQVIFVAFKEKPEKRYREHLSSFRGRKVLIGEPKQGITLTEKNIQRTGGAEAKNEIWVLDQSDPENVAYEIEDDGKKVKARKGKVLSFAGDDVENMGYVDRYQTLTGLATEYGLRKTEVDEARARREAAEKGTREWFGAQGVMVGRLEKLQSWLDAMGFPAAAKKMQREVDKQRKDVAKDAVAAREQMAKGTARLIETPEKLVEISQELTGGKAVFKAQESLHLRIIYLTKLSDAQVKSLLELGEKVIEGFRREFVDPYHSDTFRDHIPDGLFQEFYFGPDDIKLYEQFAVRFYGHNWGSNEEHKKRRLESGGANMRAGGPRRYVAYWKLNDDNDLEGIICHRLGHTLADLHYNRGNDNNAQPWIEEACGHYLSYGYLGRNSVNCFQLVESTYDKLAGPEGEKTVQLGLRGHFNALALKAGPPIDTLSAKRLYDMNDADFGKAWSLFDWVARRLGFEGQLWLRAACESRRGAGDRIGRWRAASEQLFGIEARQDVFAILDQRWREYASTDQVRGGD